MNIKINRNYRKPTWESIFGNDMNHSASEYEDRLGVKTMVVAGNIGWSGTKTHALIIHYVDTPDGLGIVSAWSGCGSQKWGSQLRVSASDDMHLVNCERCRPSQHI